MRNSSKRIILQPGEYYFGSAGTKVETLLGSCISITLWHPDKQIGGICHYALPGTSSSLSTRPNPRFAQDTFFLFEQSMQKHHLSITDFQIKMFGGGNMIAKTRRNDVDALENLPVGEKNVLAAFNWIQSLGGDLQVAHVGEFGYRKIIFDITKGDVWVKFTPVEQTQGDQSVLSGKN